MHQLLTLACLKASEAWSRYFHLSARQNQLPSCIFNKIKFFAVTKSRLVPMM